VGFKSDGDFLVMNASPINRGVDSCNAFLGVSKVIGCIETCEVDMLILSIQFYHEASIKHYS
jgi:hypothetical protein